MSTSALSKGAKPLPFLLESYTIEEIKAFPFLLLIIAVKEKCSQHRMFSLFLPPFHFCLLVKNKNKK